MTKHFSLILRGHIRDSFKTNQLLEFTKKFIQQYPNSDVFITTWNYSECKKNASWKYHSGCSSEQFTQRQTITIQDINNYFKDITIRNIMILDEDKFYKDMKYVSFSEKVGDTIAPFLGHLSMYWNQFQMIEWINKHYPYTHMINMRIDFFSKYLKNCSHIFYGDIKITNDLIFQKLDSIQKDLNPFCLIMEQYKTGIDNIMFGTIQSMYKIISQFTYQYKQIIKSFTKQYYIVNQELFLALQATKIFPLTLKPNDVLIKKKKTICLVMIVKNETKVLQRCFDSVKHYIDCYCIHDTGSTDGTQQFIKDYFKQNKIPGKLFNTQWVNFGYNRTMAVQSAYNKADYLLLMDADFIFIPSTNHFKHLICYDKNLIKYQGSLDYRQTLLVSGYILWKYIGVTHEYITQTEQNQKLTYGSFDGFTMLHFGDGGCRSDKFERDIIILEKALKYYCYSRSTLTNIEKEINELIDKISLTNEEIIILQKQEHDIVRYTFYLAQSYKDIDKHDKAILWYNIRIKYGGWHEEVYYSMFQLGQSMLLSNKYSFKEYSKVLLDAYNFRPCRLEALCLFVRQCRLQKKYNIAFRYAVGAIDTNYPENDFLFVDKNVHDWKFLDEFALCCHFMNQNILAKFIYDKLFENQKIPKTQIERFKQNYFYYNI